MSQVAIILARLGDETSVESEGSANQEIVGYPSYGSARIMIRRAKVFPTEKYNSIREADKATFLSRLAPPNNAKPSAELRHSCLALW